MEKLEELTDEELKDYRRKKERRLDEIAKEEKRRSNLERIKWHQEQIREIALGEALDEDICEWCGANHTRGEECDDIAHYLNR